MAEPPTIHPTACVDPAARIGDNTHIGPFCVVAADVHIGAGCRIGPHVVINGGTRLGRDNIIHPGACVGGDSQDKKYKGQSAYLVVGDRNTIREGVTLNRASGLDESTVIGNDNLLMAYSHVAHNCVIGNHIVLANSAALAGWVVVEDFAIIGGLTPVHQFCRIGQHSIAGGKSKITRDIPPFLLADGHPARPYGLNIRGLRRRGFTDETITALKRAYRILYQSNFLLRDALQRLRRDFAAVPEVLAMAQFIEKSERGIVRPHPKGRNWDNS